MKRITISIEPIPESNTNQEIHWISQALGLFNERDKEKSCHRIFVELIKAKQPLFFLAENVPGLLSDKHISEFIKIIKVKLEEAKVSLRKEREKTWNDIVAKEENSDITEDEKFRAKEDLQKEVDAINKKLEELAAKKEVELRA